MKKVFVTRLIGLLVLLTNCLLVSSQGLISDGIEYVFYGDIAIIINVDKNYQGHIVIPSRITYNGKTYSVTNIGAGAFGGCSGLTSITLPESLTAVSEKAFKGCNSLNAVYISDLEAFFKIHFDVEYDNWYEGNPLYFAGHLFLNGEEIRDLEIPNSITSINMNTCVGWYALNSLKIPNSVTWIVSGAFAGCTGLKTIVSEIEKPYAIHCFSDETYKVAELIVPKGTKAAYLATEGWNKFTKITEADVEVSEFSVDGIYYKVGEGNTVSVTSGESTNYYGNLVIPSQVTYNGTTYSVTSIGKNAFHDNSAITSVTIPGTVSFIDKRAFGACTSLTSVSIPNSVTEIAPAAFYGCSALRNVTLPSGLKRINDNLFWGCTNLTSIAIPESATSIGEEAFRECLALPSVTIPSSVTEIGDRAFEDCSSLKDVISEIQKPFAISDDVFSGISSNATLTVPVGTRSAYKASAGWNTFQSIVESSLISEAFEAGGFYYTIGEGNTVSVTSGENANFYGNIVIPSQVTYNGTTYSVTSIGKNAFHDNSAITSVTIPSTVIFIDKRAFGACTSLTSVSIPNSVTEIAPAAFYGCSALRNVTLPSGLKKVDDNLFWGCTSLTSVTIPESVTIIGEEAFRECLALPSITIPNSITEIGDRAFEDCSSLKEVISEIQKPFAISDNVFAGIASKATLTVPRGTKSAYQNTTGWKFASITDGTTEIQTKRTIHVATAGTLPQLISEYEKYQIEELTLTGHINGTDLGFLREMAGKATSYREDTYLGSHLFDWDVINNTEGKLKVLDLSGVNITSGGAYLTIYEEYDISTTKYYYVQSNEIPEGVFGGCRSLTSITLPNSVTSIGDKAFIKCFGLTSINIPNSVTFIASNAFSETAWYGNQPDGLVYAGKVAYKYKGEMSEKTNITIKDGTYGVTGYAFVDCKNLASVNIPNSVSTIGSHAFYNCKGLTSITIPNSVTSIGSGAFRGCSGMNTVVSEIEKPFEIDSYVFEGIPSDAELIVPNGTKATYQTTKGWNIFTKIKETSGNDEPEIVLTALSYTREYGEANPVFEYTVEGDGQNGTPTIISDATSTSPVGTYPIKISKGSITNDNVTFVDGTLTITKAPLTITAKNYSREQGQANPNFEVTYSGFKNGETEAMLTKRPTVTTMATSSSSPGTYDIEVSGAEAQNYSFIYNKGMLTVTEKDEVAFTVDAITYQGTKSAKSVVVKTVDAGQNCFEIPASVSNDGTTYQVTGVADDAFKSCSMAALIWNVEAALPNNAFSNASIGSNFLLFVKSSSYAPSSVKNVVVNGTAQSIVLSDDGGQFYCPQPFTAHSISYTHNYSMETGTGKAKGWESIALPFDVQKITHSTRGEIVPFPAYSSGSNQKPFWLGNMSVSGFKRASSIQAYEPYIISMPNNSKYKNDYNLAGDVTFSAENVQITKTPSFSGTFLPAFATVTKSPTVYALNVNNRYVKYSGNDDPGSCFISNLRDIRPFEAYLTGNFTRSVIEIGFDDDTTDMLDVLLSTDEAQEMTIYTLSGLQVTRTTQRDFDAVWRELPKGVYIVNGKKLIK